MKHSLITVAMVASCSAAMAFGVQQAPSPQFEVASVRRSSPESGTGATFNGSTTLWSPAFRKNGQVTIRSATMRQLITLAYKEVAAADYLGGGPNWLDTRRV